MPNDTGRAAAKHCESVFGIIFRVINMMIAINKDELDLGGQWLGVKDGHLRKVPDFGCLNISLLGGIEF